MDLLSPSRNESQRTLCFLRGVVMPSIIYSQYTRMNVQLGFLLSLISTIMPQSNHVKSICNSKGSWFSVHITQVTTIYTWEYLWRENIMAPPNITLIYCFFMTFTKLVYLRIPLYVLHQYLPRYINIFFNFSLERIFNFFPYFTFT